MTKLELLETLGTVDEKYVRDAQQELLSPERQAVDDPFAVHSNAAEKQEKKEARIEKLGHVAVAAAITAIFVTAGVILHRNADMFRSVDPGNEGTSASSDANDDLAIAEDAPNFLGGIGELKVVTGAGNVNVLEDRDYWYIGTHRAAKNVASPDGSYVLEDLCEKEGCQHDSADCPLYMAEHIDCEDGSIWMYSDDGTVIHRLNWDGSYAENIGLKRLLDLCYGGSKGGPRTESGIAFNIIDYDEDDQGNMIGGQITQGIVPGPVNFVKTCRPKYDSLTGASLHGEVELVLMTCWMLDADPADYEALMYTAFGTEKEDPDAVNAFFKPTQHLLLWNRSVNEVYEVVTAEPLTRALTADDVQFDENAQIIIHNDLTLLTDEDWKQYNNDGYAPESVPDTVFTDHAAMLGARGVDDKYNNYPAELFMCYVDYSSPLHKDDPDVKEPVLVDGYYLVVENNGEIVYKYNADDPDAMNAMNQMLEDRDTDTHRIRAHKIRNGCRNELMAANGSAWLQYDQWVGADGKLWNGESYVTSTVENEHFNPETGSLEGTGMKLKLGRATQLTRAWTDFSRMDGIDYAISGGKLIWSNTSGFSETVLAENVAGWELETVDNREAVLLHKDGTFMLVNSRTGEIMTFR